MKIEITNISSVQREMKLTIEAEQTSKDYYKILNKIKKHVAIPGFRKGKSPTSLIERNYADYIKEEFYNQNLGEYYKQALDQENINPVNQGEAKDVKWEKGKDLEATFTFEVMPEIKVEKYKGLEIPFEKIKFSKTMVDDTIEDFRHKMGNEIDAETAERSDKLNITINFLDENDEVTKNIDRDIVLGENQYSAPFNKNLTGKKVNDEVKTKLFTAGQEVDEADFSEAVKYKEFLVKINSIKRLELPEVNDEFAKDLEYSSLDEMKEKLETDLKAKLETENNNHLKDAIYAALIKANPFELPSTMVNKYAEQMAKPYAEAYKMDISQMLPYYVQMAEFNMKGHYIMEELKKIENLEISETDLEETIKEAADNMKMDVQEYKEMYKKQVESEDFKFAVTERKIIDLIKSTAKFVPLPKQQEKAAEEAGK